MSERFKVRVAAIIILEKEEKVFLMRRSNTGWEDGKYNLPSGHVEEGEFPLDSAAREAKEETGVTINNEDLEFVHIDFIDSYIHLYFKAKKWDGDPQIMERDKCDEMIWAEYSKLPSNLAGKTQEILEAIKSRSYYSEHKI